MQRLQLETVPLNGRSLIEASAGTGKTYTISHIILRLILLPQQGLKQRPLKIEEILVVTFTKAATQELKDRIRANINSAQRYVEGEETTDPTLKAIVDEAVNAEDKETIYLRCREAALCLDDAPVFTIHGFCQRVLAEHSFGTGQSYQQTLVENNRDILQQLGQQLWREKNYRLSPEQAVFVSGVWAHPDALIDDIGKLLDETLSVPETEHSFTALSEKAIALYKKAEAIWQQESEVINALFEGKKLGRSYQANHMPARMAALEHYLTSASEMMTGWIDKLDFFTQSIINAKCNEQLEHSLFLLLDELAGFLKQLKPVLKSEYRQRLIELVKQYQAENAILFFDDLIRNLAHAVGRDQSLVNHLADQYPVALIDEFQDTDQCQYHIFREIYAAEEGQAMLMIGDPKQAIYSFRGADIFTYFKARQDVIEEKRYTLDTNWRSKPELVGNVNSIFMRQQDAFVQKNFPQYSQVESPDAFANMKGLLTTEGDSTFSVLSLEDMDSAKIEDVRQQAAEKTAEFVASLLGSHARLNDKAIEPGDITILVRKSKQAEIMKAALSAMGINSVYLAKDSVLNTDEARSFLCLLKPCANPYNTTAIYTALADGLIAYTATNIHNIILTPSEFQDIQQQFLLAHELWLRKGFMPMWHQITCYFEVAERCLSSPDGERRLTNLNQVAEIFQQLDNSRLGFDQQLERFQQWIFRAAENDEYQKLRLETEANLVEIATIHASKGLEYPLVCCPFLFDSGSVNNSHVVVFDESRQQRVIHWQADETIKSQKESEEFSEDIRLLYVALTRAVYHFNCCWGLVKDVDKSALWHLLYHQSTALKQMDSDQLWQPFREMQGCVINPQPVVGNLEEQADKESRLSAPIFKRNLEQHYVARSYSALLPTHQKLNMGDDLSAEKERDEYELLNIVISQPEFEYSIFHFPKGSEAGNFMHQVLENTDFQQYQSQLPEELSRLLKQYGYDTAWQSALLNHFTECICKYLHHAGCALQQLSEQQLVKEMDFNLNADNCSGEQLARLLSAYREGEAVLQLNDIKGMFKGFIDLVFESNGQYYVLDYKSNFLGFSEEDYNQSAMHEAIKDHCYDLQYLIYLAALQRYLKHCLPDYTYETHIGGVYYLFLRGINSDTEAGIYYARPAEKIINAIESLFMPGEMFEGSIA